MALVDKSEVPVSASVESAPEATPPKPRGRPAKKVEAVEAVEASERGANGDTSIDEMDAEEQAETESEVTETAEDEQPPLTLSTVVKAFKDYAKIDGRDAALAVLKKFKVKSVQDLTVKQYPEVMKALDQ